MSELRVNEFFGPTFQGEGPWAGRVCHFLRLSRCNQHCSWCDTPYTWAHTATKAELHDSKKMYDLRENETMWSIEQALGVLQANNVKFLVISGGEPLLQKGPLEDLIDGTDGDLVVQFETAGTLPPLDGWDWTDGIHYVVSPKLENSGNALTLRYQPKVLSQFNAKRANFKFVVQEPEDLVEVSKIQKDIGIDLERMWIMPEGTSVEKVVATARKLADPAIDYGYNLSMRNHILLWDDERGR
jgi:7-carboxy-7-deazaguanine synthase